MTFFFKKKKRKKYFYLFIRRNINKTEHFSKGSSNVCSTIFSPYVGGVTVLILWEGNSSTEVKWIVLNHTGEWEILDFLSILP